jgi:hypothetical protein
MFVLWTPWPQSRQLRYPERQSEEFREKYDSLIKFLKKKNANTGNSNLDRQVVASQPSYPAAFSALAMSAETPNPQLKHEWLLDTCASYHMTPCKDAFASFSSITGDRIKDANGGFGSVNGIGKVVLDVDDGILELEDVRYVPTLTSNLISYGLLEDQGFTLGVSNTKPLYNTICTSSGDVFCAHKTEYTGVYRIGSCTKIADQNDTEILAYSVESAPDVSVPASHHPPTKPIHNMPKKPEFKSHKMTLMEWHQRLSHLNAADILKLARDPASGVVITGSKTLGFCDVCHDSQSKANQEDFSHTHAQGYPTSNENPYRHCGWR